VTNQVIKVINHNKSCANLGRTQQYLYQQRQVNIQHPHRSDYLCLSGSLLLILCALR